jgi:hypothetical protein
MEQNVVSKKTLKRRSQRREQTMADLKDENARLKAMLACQMRKAEHGCSDASCKLCDPERPEDRTWELT